MSAIDPNKTNVLNAFLAEYNTLRSELLGRIQTQNQTFNFLLIIVGASITAVITTANSNRPENLVPVTFAVVLLLPLVTCPLAYMFFDNELMIHAIGSYIYWDRRLKFIELTSNEHLFGSITDFKYLPPSTHKVFSADFAREVVPLLYSHFFAGCFSSYVHARKMAFPAQLFHSP
jgi:hypothetical protein